VGANLAGQPCEAAPAPAADVTKTRSYNENMEYRRLGRTGLMVSAVGIGGHVKRIPFRGGSPDFKKNRREVLAACIAHGINYADPCGAGEVLFVAEALGKDREKMYLGFDWSGARNPGTAGNLDKMKEQLDTGLRQAKLEYVDLWRVTMHVPFLSPKTRLVDGHACGGRRLFSGRPPPSRADDSQTPATAHALRSQSPGQALLLCLDMHPS
jgi:hypothetical protein